MKHELAARDEWIIRNLFPKIRRGVMMKKNDAFVISRGPARNSCLVLQRLWQHLLSDHIGFTIAVIYSALFSLLLQSLLAQGPQEEGSGVVSPPLTPGSVLCGYFPPIDWKHASGSWRLGTSRLVTRPGFIPASHPVTPKARLRPTHVPLIGNIAQTSPLPQMSQHYHLQFCFSLIQLRNEIKV